MLLWWRILHRYTLLQTDDVTHRSLLTEHLLCADTLTQRVWCTEKFLRTDAFTHTQRLLRKKCTETVTHRCFARRCFCLRPENRPSVFAFFALWYVGWGGVGGCNNVLCLPYHRFSSVNTLHVTLYISAVLRWPNFMLRCTLLLYIGEHTSCYVAHFCCASVNTLHVAKRKTIQKT